MGGRERLEVGSQVDALASGRVGDPQHLNCLRYFGGDTGRTWWVTEARLWRWMKEKGSCLAWAILLAEMDWAWEQAHESRRWICLFTAEPPQPMRTVPGPRWTLSKYLWMNIWLKERAQKEEQVWVRTACDKFDFRIYWVWRSSGMFAWQLKIGAERLSRI